MARAEGSTVDSTAFLHLDLQKQRSELQAFLRLAASFLHTTAVYSRLTEPLDNARVGGQFHWEVPKCNPIRTNASTEYEGAEKTAAYPVVACISFCFIGEASSPPRPKGGMHKKSMVPDFVCLDTQSVIHVKFVRCEGDGGTATESDLCVREFTFDLGHRAHPTGPLLHIDLENSEVDEGNGSMVKRPPIPRLPSLVAAPVDALEFALCELFPNTWITHRNKMARKYADSTKGHNERTWRILDEYRSAAKEMGWPGIKGATGIFMEPF